MDREQFLSISRTSEVLNLPVAFIRREARARRIPSIQVGRRFMFDVAAVRQALVSHFEPEGRPRNLGTLESRNPASARAARGASIVAGNVAR